jgi:GNAT superfamily N-acetyltransferase
MPVAIDAMVDASAKSALCAAIIAELPRWFGRPESNARYIDGVGNRSAFAAVIDGQPRGMIALEYHFGVTCNIWWLGVSPRAHRHGLGRALIERAAQEATAQGCRYLAVETLSPRFKNPEYDLTRRFYTAVGFAPFVEFEPEPGDHMMWMLRVL